MSITSNEIKFILELFKNPETDYNANSIAKKIGLSAMGALKIAKKLQKENILISKRFGKAVFYKLNNNEYTRNYIKFLLKKEAESADPYIKKWINEIKKIKNAESVILFGSVLNKHKEAKDIDILLITNKRKFLKLKKEINEINLLNIKKLHPVYQTKDDFKENLKKDKIVLNAIKGIIIFGEDVIIRLLEE